MPRYGLRMNNMDNRIFLFSNVPTALQKDLVTKVKSLGGTCKDSKGFDKNISHLVCNSLKKTEKFFGACISGKWIVSPQFILDSHEVGMWLDEDNYLFRVENKNPVSDKMALTARRWRTQVHSFKIVPFQDWRVALLLTAEKAAVFKRLLRYGGAEILKLSRPLSKCSQLQYISYVFVDNQHGEYVPELQELGLLCLKESFLGDFIMEDPSPDPFDYILTNTSGNVTLLDRSVEPGNKSKSSTDASSLRKTNLLNDAPCSSRQSSSAVTSFTELKVSHTPQMTNVIDQSNKAVPPCGVKDIPCDKSSSSQSIKKKMDSAADVRDEKNTLKTEITDEKSALKTKPALHRVDSKDSGKMPNKQFKSEGIDSLKGNSQASLGNSVDRGQSNKKCSLADNGKLPKQQLGNQQNGKSDNKFSHFSCDSCQPSDPSNPVIDSNHIEKVGIVIAQENDIVPGTKLSRTANKSVLALEYLDPNVPSVHSQSSNQSFANQKNTKLSSDLKSSYQTGPDHSLSTKPQKNIKATTGSAQKRKLGPDEDSLQLSKQKRRGPGNMALSINIFLHSPQTSPIKNPADTTDSHCSRPPLNSYLKSQVLFSQKTPSISADHTPPKSSHHGIKLSQSELIAKEHESEPAIVQQNSDFRTPVKNNPSRPSSSKKIKSPSASLTLSPNVYLYGLSPSKSIPADQRQHSEEKKLHVQMKSKSVPGKSSPMSADVSKQKGKPTQSVLQQFGFRNFSKDKDSSQRPSTVIPKSEPITPTQRAKKWQPQRQLFIGPESDDGVIIILSDDEEESQLSKSGKQNDVTVISSGTEEDDSVQVVEGSLTSTVQPAILTISSSAEDDEETDNDNCEHQRNVSKLNLQEKEIISPSCKDIKHVRNVFEDIFSPRLNSAEHAARDEMGSEIVTANHNLNENSIGKNNEVDRSSHLDAKGDQRSPLAVKRKLIHQLANISSSCSKIENSEDSMKTKEPTVVLERLGKEKNHHLDVKDDQRSPLVAKRKLFHQLANTSSSCSKIDNSDRSMKTKVPIVVLERLGKEKMNSFGKKCSVADVNSNVLEPLKVKDVSCNKLKNIFKIPLVQQEYEASSSENGDENSIKMDQLPHVAWSSSCIGHVTPTTADKQFVPSIVSQCMESSRENGFFSTVLDHGKPTLARMPNVDLLHQLIHLLACDDFIVSNQAFSDLMSWAQNHPPITSSMIKVYSDLFGLGTNQTLLCDLLQCLTDTHVSSGKFYLLEFVVAVFEMNFSSCVHSRDRKTLKDCLLIKWLWSHSQAIHHNSKTKELLRVFEAVLSQSQSTSTAFHSMATLISVVAECFRLSSVHWNTQNRYFLSDTITSFALDITRIIRDAFPDTEPFYITSHILSFKPAWFRTMITASMLSIFNDYLLNQSIQVRDISLCTIVSQFFFLLPPLSCQQHVETVHKPAVLSVSSQHHDGDLASQFPNKSGNIGGNFDLVKDKTLTASKVNKTNGKGESALHIAARKGDVVTMKKLLSIPGIDVNLKDYNGWTPLHEACNHGRQSCVELLLKYVPQNTSLFWKKDGNPCKVDVNAFADQDITPLHDAVMNNRIEICKLLLKFGGESILETKTVKGNTAFDLAPTKEMYQVLSAGVNDNVHHSSISLNLSQDSQSEDSISLSQSDFGSSSNNGLTLPSDYKYEQVLNTDDTDSNFSANYSDCSLFVSLITLLLNSYFEATSVTTQSKNGGLPAKVNLLKLNETIVLRKMRCYVKVFRKHLRRITTPDTFDRLEAQLSVLSATISGHTTPAISGHTTQR